MRILHPFIAKGHSQNWWRRVFLDCVRYTGQHWSTLLSTCSLHVLTATNQCHINQISLASMCTLSLSYTFAYFSLKWVISTTPHFWITIFLTSCLFQSRDLTILVVNCMNKTLFPRPLEASKVPYKIVNPAIVQNGDFLS